MAQNPFLIPKMFEGLIEAGENHLPKWFIRTVVYLGSICLIISFIKYIIDQLIKPVWGAYVSGGLNLDTLFVGLQTLGMGLFVFLVGKQLKDSLASRRALIESETTLARAEAAAENAKAISHMADERRQMADEHLAMSALLAEALVEVLRENGAPGMELAQKIHSLLEADLKATPS